MNKKDEKILLGFLHSIENGQRILVKKIPAPFRLDYLCLHYGNVDFYTNDGWSMTVFFDCGEFDYVDSIHPPKEKEFNYDDFSEAIKNYRPPENIRMVMYGEPGYGGENIKAGAANGVIAEQQEQIKRLKARRTRLELAIQKVIGDEANAVGWGPDVTTLEYLTDALKEADNET